MSWHDWHHSELTVQRLYDILRLRSEIFVVEQNCVYRDIDDQDLTGTTRHLCWYDGSVLGAYSRIFESNGDVRIGRVVVDKKFRGGMGAKLLEESLKVVHRHFPEKRVVLSAQEHLQGFYGKFGFVAEGEPYDEDGIMHIEMILQ